MEERKPRLKTSFFFFFKDIFRKAFGSFSGGGGGRCWGRSFGDSSFQTFQGCELGVSLMCFFVSASRVEGKCQMSTDSRYLFGAGCHRTQ